MLRPCLGLADEPCGIATPRTRCPLHTAAHEALRPPRRARGRYDSKWMRLRALAIRQHPWCVDCHTPGSEANPLTGDHIVPLEYGGKNVMSNVAVRCRACNSAKGTRSIGAMGIGASNL